MMISILLIFLSCVFVITTLKIIFKTSKPTFDHYWHLSYIKDIQLNKQARHTFKFVCKHSNILEETNFSYPLFFHWLLSFLPFDLIKKKFLRINIIIEIGLYVFAGFLIFSFNDFKGIEQIGLIAILIVTNPFNRFIWNAKFRGLSPRNFGILLAYVYLFFFTTDLIPQQFIIRVAILSIISLLVILSSQFSTQYLVIFSFFSLFFKEFQPITALAIAIILFYVFFPATFRSYIKGQWEHKKIWFKHLAKIDLWKTRPSVYRDFIYDFYKKRNLKYFLTNPIIEALIGFPLITALLIVAPKSLISQNIVFSAFIAFFLTSFKYTRAFGEPQRYLEMALPGLIFLGLKYLSAEQLELMVIVNLVIFVMHVNVFVDFNSKPRFSEKVITQITSIVSEDKSKTPLLISNNWGFVGYFLPDKSINLLMPTFTNWYQYGFPINKVFPEALFSIDKDVIIEWIKNFNPGWFLLEDYYWDANSFEESLQKNGISYNKSLIENSVLLYQLKNHK